MLEMSGSDKMGRNASLDYLRVVAVVLVIMGHIESQTIISQLPFSNSFSYYFSLVLGNFERPAITIFLMISSWFLVDKSFSSKRLLSVWVDVFFYNSIITIFIFALGLVPFSPVYLIQSFLPIMGRPQWYMCEYLLLLLLQPYINVFLSSISSKRLRGLLIIVFIFVIAHATIFPIETTAPFFSELVWFIYVYMFMYYMKNNQIELQRNKCAGLLMAIFGFVVIVGINLVDDFCGEVGLMGNVVHILAVHYTSHYEAIPAFCFSLGMFFLFLKADMKENCIISMLAKASGVIYIIHQVPVLWRYSDWGFTIWNGIFHADKFILEGYTILSMISYTLIILVVGVSCDYIFRHTLKPYFIKSWMLNKVGRLLDNIEGE